MYLRCLYYTSATHTDFQWADAPKQMAMAALQDCTTSEDIELAKCAKVKLYFTSFEHSRAILDFKAVIVLYPVYIPT